MIKSSELIMFGDQMTLSKITDKTQRNLIKLPVLLVSTKDQIWQLSVTWFRIPQGYLYKNNPDISKVHIAHTVIYPKNLWSHTLPYYCPPPITATTIHHRCHTNTQGWQNYVRICVPPKKSYVGWYGTKDSIRLGNLASKVDSHP